MANLTKYEQETIINYNNEEKKEPMCRCFGEAMIGLNIVCLRNG